MSSQDRFYVHGFDYERGSPHLKHDELRSAISGSLEASVSRSLAEIGRCRTLELGAGHGTFTGLLRQFGAEVVVTEMSSASASRLRQRFARDQGVTVVHDHDGDWIFRNEQTFDLVVCLSVLHHIPDYLRTVDRLTCLLAPGGTFASWQDPIWYPSTPRYVRVASTASYFAWRLGRGRIRRAVSTRMRRLRGVLDESRPEDMTEYHVVRQGVDQQAILDLLSDRFTTAAVLTYWSTQAAPLQRLGELIGLANTFAIEATGALTGSGPWADT